MSASSILSSQGRAMALATAMAALSGTVIVLSFCLHKSRPSVLKSCFSSVGKKKEIEKKKRRRRRVRFAEDVVNSTAQNAEFQKKKIGLAFCSSSSPSRTPPSPLKLKKIDGGGSSGMPPNRAALYNGILRDRLVQRIAYSL